MLTLQQTLELAKKAGFTVGRDAGGDYVAPKYTDSIGTVQRLVQAAYAAGQAAERKAQLAEIETGIWFDQSTEEVLESLADAIRSRGKKGGV